MKASLASWGVFILATTAALGTGATKSDGVLCDDQQEIVSACCDENQGKDANVIAEDGITFPRPPLWTNPLAKLKKRQGGSITKHDPPDISTTSAGISIEMARTCSSGSRVDSSSSRVGNSNSSSSSSSSSSSVIGGGGSGIDEANDTTVENSIEAAREASKKQRLPITFDMGYRVNKRLLDVSKKVKPKQRSQHIAVSKLLPGSAYTKRLTKRPMACPKDPWVRKPTCALRVGDTLTGTLRSPEGNSALWPGVDGSLRFGQKHPVKPLTEERSGPATMRFSTLLASNPDKARKALDARRTVLPEEGSKDAETKKIKGAFGGWLPWTRRDMTDGIETSDASVETKRTIPAWSPWDRGAKREIVENIEVAPASAEEVCVSVSNKGCVTVTVDGTTVLSKSGQFKWDWLNRLPWTRPKDDGYEVHATETGMEVRLGERTVWGITAEEWMG